MTKKFVMAIIASLLLAVMANSAFAQGTVTYAVGVQIKNLDQANAADVTITYYAKTGGTTTFDVPGGIPAGGSFTMATLQGVAENFDGSAVVSSNRQIAAIANVFGNGAMGASYTAFSNGDTTSNLPLILKNHYGFNTLFNVQNVGTASTTVTVSYSGTAQTESATIAPGAAATFTQATNASLPDPAGAPGYVGSARVTSSGGVPIVATVLQQGPTTLLGYDGFRPGDSSTNPAMPLINSNNYGYVTGVQIQNTGGAATNVTVSYTPSGPGLGTACTETHSIPANSSATFADAAFRTTNAGENCANGATFVGSARVTTNSGNQPLVAIVNQLNSGQSKGAAYGAFNPANGTAAVELPLIMDRNYRYWTGYAVVNVGTSATTVTCDYTNLGASFNDSATIQPGQALTVQNINKLGNGYVGAATCTASGSGRIVAIVNELGNDYPSDTFLVYEGTNR